MGVVKATQHDILLKLYAWHNMCLSVCFTLLLFVLHVDNFACRQLLGHVPGISMTRIMYMLDYRSDPTFHFKYFGRCYLYILCFNFIFFNLAEWLSFGV